MLCSRHLRWLTPLDIKGRNISDRPTSCFQFDATSFRMVCRSICTGMFVLLSLYVLFIYHCQGTLAAPGGGNNAELHRPRLRTFSRFRPNNQYSRIKPEVLGEFIVDDDDLFELPKRQTSDDYGHLRFGKRGEDQFDDYGHMRFGRSGSDSN